MHQLLVALLAHRGHFYVGASFHFTPIPADWSESNGGEREAGKKWKRRRCMKGRGMGWALEHYQQNMNSSKQVPTSRIITYFDATDLSASTTNRGY